MRLSYALFVCYMPFLVRQSALHSIAQCCTLAGARRVRARRLRFLLAAVLATLQRRSCQALVCYGYLHSQGLPMQLMHKGWAA